MFVCVTAEGTEKVLMRRGGESPYDNHIGGTRGEGDAAAVGVWGACELCPVVPLRRGQGLKE